MEVDSFIKKCRFVLVQIKHFPGQQTGKFTNVFPSHVHPIHKSTSALIFLLNCQQILSFYFLCLVFLFFLCYFFFWSLFSKEKTECSATWSSSKNQIFKLWGKMWAVPEFPLKFPKHTVGEKSQFRTVKAKIYSQSIARIWEQFVIITKVKK